MNIVPVELATNPYPVAVLDAADADLAAFGRFAVDVLSRSWAGRGCRTALVVTDGNLEAEAGAYAGSLAMAGINPALAVVEPGEGSKSLEVAATLYDRLIDGRADRHTCVVAVGGGVVGDLAGFVAATFARGLPLLMVPTSLLAMVDSSVGGKVGVNRPGAKNIIGAFHQPSGVWVDAGHLASLPEREFRCGMAEVVKYGVILDPDFFARLEAEADAINAGDRAAIARVIVRCCELKAGVVARDEREETGLRAVLNFGHTVGHAIEAVAGYGGDFRHGEAVSIGMVAESRLAEKMGWIAPEVTDRLITLLRRFGLPVEPPDLDPTSLIDAMRLDKKNAGGEIRFVLPRAIGRVEATRADPAAILDAIRAPARSGET